MARLIVERDKILKNVEIVIQEVATANIIGVIKGNGYGLSLVPFAKTLREGGIAFFAVCNLCDCERLRAAQIHEKILLMTPLIDKDDVKKAIALDIIMTVSSYDNAVLISAAADELEKRARVHVKVDTGFGRYGFDISETDKIAAVYTLFSSLSVEGIYSHLSDAFGKDKKHTISQCEAFEKVLKDLARREIDPGVRHILNSCGTLRFPEYKYDAVRIGSAFLGRLPIKNKWGFEKVGFLEGTIINLKWLKKGKNVGYANVCKIKEPTLAAVVDVGYHDGFCLEKSKDTFRFRDVLRYMFGEFKRLFSKKIFVLVKSKKAQVLGRVSMTSTTINVTNIDCALGDAVKIPVNPLMVAEHVERTYV